MPPTFDVIAPVKCCSVPGIDAVYRIVVTTEAITWKLRGLSTAQNLKITTSPYPTNFFGQHYARMLSNDTITVLDNGTFAVLQDVSGHSTSPSI